MLGRHNLGVAYARKAKDVSASDEEAHWLALADAELRRAIELQGPENESARSHVELGKVLARQGRNRDAIAVYNQGARIEPGDFQIHHALGILHHREGERERAAEAFHRALKLAPRHVMSAVRLGETLLELDRAEEAAPAFRHALQISPNNARAQRGLAAARQRMDASPARPE
jgi:tetratricopeptide (TPR) repeat protein